MDLDSLLAELEAADAKAREVAAVDLHAMARELLAVDIHTMARELLADLDPVLGGHARKSDG